MLNWSDYKTVDFETLLPKLEALLSVRLCITLAPKKLHLRRKSWARFFTDRPLCFPGWSETKPRRGNLLWRTSWYLQDNHKRRRAAVTLMTLCSTTESNHSMKDSTVAFFLSNSFNSWKMVMESSGKRTEEATGADFQNQIGFHLGWICTRCSAAVSHSE